MWINLKKRFMDGYYSQRLAHVPVSDDEVTESIRDFIFRAYWDLDIDGKTAVKLLDRLPQIVDIDELMRHDPKDIPG